MNKLIKFILIIVICGSMAGITRQGVLADAQLSTFVASEQSDSKTFGEQSSAAVVGVPVPMAPLGIISDTTPTYKWSKVAGATQYQIILNKNGNLHYNKIIPPSVCGLTTCSSSPKKILPYAGYTWKIRAMVNGAWKSYSSIKSFRIASPIPNIISPAGVITDTTPSYKWSKVANTTEYQIKLFKNGNLFLTKNIRSGACNATTCVNTQSKALPYANYTWKVRAKIAGVWKPFSTPKAFSVISPIPYPLSPSGNISDTTPTYTWKKITGATQYRYFLYKGTKLQYTQTVPGSVCGATTCSHTPTTVLPIGSYTWKVQSQVNGVWYAMSTAKPFIIVNITPNPISPTGNISDITPTYTWSKVPGASQYQVFLYKGATLIYSPSVLATKCGTSTCSNTPTKSLLDGSYSWKVRAMIGGSWKPVSALKTFSLKAPVTIPTAISPSGVTYDTTPTFLWSKIIGATYYRYQLYKGSALHYQKTVPASACGTTTCSNTPTTVLPFAIYSWKTQALVGGSWKSFSTPKTFSLVNNVPSPLSPSGIIGDNTPTYTWSKITNASSYQIILYKDTNIVYTKNVTSASTCQTSTCSYTPADVLAISPYTWKIAALVSGTWSNFSPIKSFSLINLGNSFYSPFTSNALGWSSVWGTWELKSGGFYSTVGVINNGASVKHSDLYATLTYEARMNRLGSCTNCGNYLIIRGTVSPLDPTLKHWDNSVRFQYTNNGFFSVWKTKNGIQSRIINWTESEAIVPDDWNILKVTANGNNMKFYINETLVWSGAVAAESSGQVGLGMYTNAPGNILSVDWARLDPVVVASETVNEVDTKLIEGVIGAGDGFLSP